MNHKHDSIMTQISSTVFAQYNAKNTLPLDYKNHLTLHSKIKTRPIAR
jgi:hypothetical protein